MVDRPPALDRPLVGFRAWRITRRGLRCLTSDDVWPLPGVVDARCGTPTGGLVPHQAPVAGCHCGAYAVDSVATLRRYLAWHRGLSPLRRRDVVIGAVQLWGAPGRPVVVGELRGRPGLQFRAPHARVLALAAHPRLGQLGELAVPVVPAEGLEVLAREIGGVQLRRPACAAPAAPAGPDVADLVAVVRWLAEALRWLAPRAWRSLRWLFTRRLTWWALAAGAYALAYHRAPAFMGLVTALAVVLAILAGWARGWLRSFTALLTGRAH